MYSVFAYEMNIIVILFWQFINLLLQLVHYSGNISMTWSWFDREVH